MRKGIYSATLGKTQYMGWDVYRLSNNLVSLLVAPDLGGRAIQLLLGDWEYFFVNATLAGQVLRPEENDLEAGGANYGGDKVWPAPEGWMSDDEWPSVPYYTLDGSRFKAEVVKETSDEVAVRVISPSDPRTGVQFERVFHVYSGTTRIRVDQLMRNISRRQIRWGIWHLIQHNAADCNNPKKANPDLFMYIPLNPRSIYPEGYTKLLGDVQHPSYEVIDGGRMLRVRYLYRAGKIGADSDHGWYAVINGQKNICLVENFKYFPGAEYPDKASVESWSNGPGTISRGPFDHTLLHDPEKTPYFFESETLSPYAALDPGEQYSFPVYWSVTRAPNPIRNAVWAGAISEPLSGRVESGRVSLRGIFGVFTPGKLEAVLYSAQGEELGREILLSVDPREEVCLETTLSVPECCFRIGVSVRDAEGENCGFLGNMILK